MSQEDIMKALGNSGEFTLEKITDAINELLSEVGHIVTYACS